MRFLCRWRGLWLWLWGCNSSCHLSEECCHLLKQCLLRLCRLSWYWNGKISPASNIPHRRSMTLHFFLNSSLGCRVHAITYNKQRNIYVLVSRSTLTNAIYGMHSILVQKHLNRALMPLIEVKHKF